MVKHLFTLKTGARGNSFIPAKRNRTLKLIHSASALPRGSLADLSLSMNADRAPALSMRSIASLASHSDLATLPTPYGFYNGIVWRPVALEYCAATSCCRRLAGKVAGQTLALLQGATGLHHRPPGPGIAPVLGHHYKGTAGDPRPIYKRKRFLPFFTCIRLPFLKMRWYLLIRY